MESRSVVLSVAALVLVVGTASLPVSLVPAAGDGADRRANATTTAGTASPSAAVTDAPTTTTTDRSANASLPPGVNASGVENPAVLVEAHQRGLNNTSFAFRFRANVSVGPANQWTVQRGRVEENGSPLVVRSESLRLFDGDASRVATDLWANGSDVVVKYHRADRTELRRYNRSGGNLADETWAHLPRADLDSQVTQAWLIELALTAGEYDLVRTERRDGRRVAVLRATEAVTATNFTDFDATVVVDAEGRVHSLSLTAGYEGDDENRIRYEFELTEVGDVSVSRPMWVGAAIPPGESNGTATTGDATTTTAGNTTTTDG